MPRYLENIVKCTGTNKCALFGIPIIRYLRLWRGYIRVMWYVGLLLAISLSGTCLARDYTFTVKLARGTSECFYDYIHEGAFLEIEYQVASRS